MTSDSRFGQGLSISTTAAPGYRPVNISVIIPALNESGHIQRSVESAWMAGALEVIVVDGGSEDDTSLIATHLGCRVIHAPRGRSRQQNAGAKVAKGDILLFLHADNRLDSSALTQIRDSFSDANRETFGGFQQRIESDRTIYRWIEFGNRLRIERYGLVYGDQAIFLNREWFFELGGFPDWDLMEDVGLSQRLAANGSPVVLDGPLHVSARRWETNGPVRQTLRNWCLLTAFRCGISPRRLALFYPVQHQTSVQPAPEIPPACNEV